MKFSFLILVALVGVSCAHKATHNDREPASFLSGNDSWNRNVGLEIANSMSLPSVSTGTFRIFKAAGKLYEVPNEAYLETKLQEMFRTEVRKTGDLPDYFAVKPIKVTFSGLNAFPVEGKSYVHTNSLGMGGFHRSFNILKIGVGASAKEYFFFTNRGVYADDIPQVHFQMDQKNPDSAMIFIALPEFVDQRPLCSGRISEENGAIAISVMDCSKAVR